MLLSQILAWVSAFLCLMECLRFAARMSKCPGLNRFFHKCHIPFGILLLVTGITHGLLAGNPASVALSGATLGAVFFTANLGTACFLCGVLLACTYLLRKKFRGHWMALHRLLTIAMAVLLVFHLIDVGIGLPQRFFDSQEMKAPTVSVLEKETSVLTPTPTPTPTSSPTPSPAPSPIPESPESASDATPSPTETVQPESSFNSAMEMPEITEESSGNGLSDGVYEGTAAGRNGPITVRVTVEAGTISYIEVLSQSETPKYYARAEEVIPSILAAGSPDVDSITGATLSSEGIKAAVANALGY